METRANYVVIGLFTWKLCRDLALAVPLDEYEQGGDPPIGPNTPDVQNDGDGAESHVDAGRLAKVGSAVAAAAGAVGAAGGYALGRRKPRTIRIRRPDP